MLTYKCINCGEIKESDGTCICSVCGYRMFEMPYDRKEVLRSEIERFIASLEINKINRDDLIFEGIEKDTDRFPSYDKILKYVSHSERTENFLKNLLETAEQLKIHFNSRFSKTYPISFESIEGIVAEYDKVLSDAFQIIVPEKKIDIGNVKFENFSLLYVENPNKYLWLSAKELLELIEKLANKIVKFIKVNNLYGNIHKYHPTEDKNKYPEDTDFKDELENAIMKTEEIIAKKYYVDIMDDGSEELKEMLCCLWNGIELIMCAPLFIKEYRFFNDQCQLEEEQFLNKISEKISKRYSGIELLLENKTEDELSDIYKELILIDKFEILVPSETEVINVGEGEQKLNNLIGLSEVKENIKKIKAYALANKDSDELNLHMCFLGNPGSGKTEVARFIADILYENKILPSNKIIEVDRSGLVSQYFGATAPKTSKVIEEAMGGVLFIDEAYALGNNSESSITDYGKEAIDTLVKAMEDNRGKFCVILAGYRNEMLQMLSVNPGFKSRIQFMVDFPNYSRNELKRIADLMLKARKYSISNAALERILDITDIKRKDPNFANAREIRNILDQVIMCQNIRCAGTNEKEIGLVDINKYIDDAKINLPKSSDSPNNRILSGEEELDSLIGLSTVKRMIKKIKAYAKRNKGEVDFNLHMCFYGNPGTGKTEVARILSRILYDAGILNEAKLVETDGHGLLGKYVGETAPKTEAKINEAIGGVLFIDEAYSLAGSAASNGGSTNYGDEAVAVLLKEMEDRRGQFCVILAGYKDEMQTMLSSNPGFKSRIQFTLDFPDYTRDEFKEILLLFSKKKNYIIENDALEKMLDLIDYFRNQPNFANARTARNILDQVIMNQNLRTEDTDDDSIILSDVEDYILDEEINLDDTSSGTHKIGFA